MEIAANKVKSQGTKNSSIRAISEGDLAIDQSALFSMLENIPVNVMFANKAGVIVYLNERSYETLKKIEKYLPIPIDEILGSSYDKFHANPSHQKKLLASDRNLPHRAVFKVGPETVELLAAPVVDKDGSYIGPMVTWDIVTERLHMENEMARIYSMMENATVNMMAADLNNVITYMNPKSRDTLKKLEKYLPIQVDRMIGSSIDAFHKNPEHQRRLLADPRNLPHTAKIKVGPESLELTVAPIWDKNKNHTGNMVSWDVITDKVRIVENLEQTAQSLATAAEELSSVAGQMSKNATLTTEKSAAAAANSEEVSTGVQTVATNTEEMVASIKEISKSSSEAAGISKEAMKKASETNATITHLGEASREIGNVIKVISSIAQQTNLLALNATIEAARAGDAGKGFAVVANEVKELAKQTAKATEEITNKISAIQESSKGAITAIGGISKVIEQINGISMTIAAAVEEQTATTNEVSRVMQESTSAVDSITQIVRSVTTAAQESESGASQTLDAARNLSQLALQIRDLVKSIKI